jgi:hypothetical protein
MVGSELFRREAGTSKFVKLKILKESALTSTETVRGFVIGRLHNSLAHGLGKQKRE